MYRKIIVCCTLVCFIVCMQGCYSKYAIPTEKLEQKPEHKNVTIVTIDGEVYEFDVISVYDDYIEGHVDDTTLVSILLEDVESVRVRRYDAAKTMWYTTGFIVIGIPLVILIALILFPPDITW